MVDLPHDVWLRVAHFLPTEVLRGLYSVNRTFFDLAMNERYQAVEISAQPGIIQKLDRLRSDPALAQRVQSLYIRTAVGQEIRQTQRYRNSFYKFPWIIHFVSILKGISRSSSGQAAKKLGVLKKLKSPEHLSQAIIDAISNLSHVTAYTIDWQRDIPPPLLIAVRSVLGPQLKRLTVHSPADNVLQNLLGEPSQCRMDSLEILEVTLYQSQPDKAKVNVKHEPMLDALCPLIHSVGTTLQSLSISVLFHHEISTFFDSLGRLPCLNRLVLHIPFDNGHLSDLSRFKHFLNNHSDTLQHLSLKPGYCFSGSRSCQDFISNQYHTWSRQCLSGVTLEHLRSLEISVKLVGGEGGILGGLSSLDGVANSLTSISLPDYYFSYDNVKALVDHRMGSKLTDLSLSIRHLSPQVVDVLANKLPQLHRLNMSIMDVVPNEGVEPIVSYDFCSAIQDQDQVELFYEEMRKRQYPAWELSHLDISKTSCCGVFPLTSHIEVISECLPVSLYRALTHPATVSSETVNSGWAGIQV